MTGDLAGHPGIPNTPAGLARVLQAEADAPRVWRHTYAPGPIPAALCGAADYQLITTGAPDCPDCLTITKACRCYSCALSCGGSNDPADGSCGPLADVDGRPVCDYCRTRADVLAEPGSRREGIQVTLSQGAVCLAVDVFSGTPSRNWLTARSARHLAEVLHRRAAELDLADAAAVGDDDPVTDPHAHDGPCLRCDGGLR